MKQTNYILTVVRRLGFVLCCIFIWYVAFNSYNSDITSNVAKADGFFSSEGKCGTGCTFIFEDRNSTLTIKGSGAIEEKAFYENTYIKRVIIDGNVTSIGDSAFYGCTSLEELNIKSKVKSIGKSAFSGCTKLAEVKLGSAVTTIEAEAFALCTDLKGISFPNTVEKIGESAFVSCDSIQSLFIPANVKEIGAAAFFGCKSLKAIYVDSNNRYFRTYQGDLYSKDLGCLYCCLSKKLTITPKELRSIMPFAFSHKYPGSEGYQTVIIDDLELSDSQYPRNQMLGENSMWLGGAGMSQVILLNPNKYSIIASPPSLPVSNPPSEYSQARFTGRIYAYDQVVEYQYGDPDAENWWFSNFYPIIDAPNVSTRVSQPIDLSLPVTAAYSDFLRITWISRDETIATVDSNGRVTPVREGTTEIYACGNGAMARYFVNTGFSDVPKNAYFYDSVYWAVDKGITGGIKNSKTGLYETFDPYGKCNRAQAITFIWRMAGCPEPKNRVNVFKDVKSSDYYYKAVLWGTENGIVGGYSDGTFKPKNTCTRAQALTFIWRYYGQPKSSSGNSGFIDVPSNSYFYDAVLWAADKKIAGGNKDGTFRPNDECNRAAMVTFLYRLKPELTHKSWTISKEKMVPATCTKDGSYVEVKTCKTCGIVRRSTVTIPKLNHQYGSIYRENEVAATCKHEGHYDEVQKCTMCGDTIRKTKYTPVRSHIWTTTISDYIPSTCQMEGSYIEIDKCSLCGETKEINKTVPKTDHVAGKSVTQDMVQATCEKDGYCYDVYYCKNCNEFLYQTYRTIPSTGHISRVKYQNERPGTCTQSGTRERIEYCSVCGKTLSESIEDTGYTHQGHSEFFDVVPATLEEDGGYQELFTCEICGRKTRFYHTEKYITLAIGETLTLSQYDTQYTVDNGYDPVIVIDGKEEAPTTSLTGLKAGKTDVYTSSKVCSGKNVYHVIVEFKDVQNSNKKPYYYTPVYWAVDAGITGGVKNSKTGLYENFDPQGKCTRGQMVSFLWRMAGCPEPSDRNCAFTDVNASDYYYKAVLWGTQNGIVGGYSDGTFKPKENCTRQQAVTFLWRMAGKPKVSGGNNSFSDVKDPGAYYYDAVLWAAQKGITGGYSDGTFRPMSACNRAQMVSFLYRYKAIYKDNEFVVVPTPTPKPEETPTPTPDPYLRGEAGPSCIYTIEKATGILTISGTGRVTKSFGGELIKTLVVESGITDLGYQCFSGCSELESVALPDGLLSMNQSFSGCGSLTSITVPSTMKYISSAEFRSCTNLKCAVIDGDNMSIEPRSMFRDCANLEEVCLCEGVIIQGGSDVFNGLTNLKKISIFSSVSRVSFSGLSNLEEVILSEGVTELDYDTFYGCACLKTLEIPKSVVLVGYEAFTGCTSLEQVTIYGQPVFREGQQTVFPSGVVVYGYPGGTVEMQASHDGVTFVSLDGTEPE